MQRAIGLFGSVAKKVFTERGRQRSSVAARDEGEEEDFDFDDDDVEPATTTTTTTTKTTRKTESRAKTPVTEMMTTTSRRKSARANASDETTVLRDVENTAPSRRRAGEDAGEEDDDEDAVRTAGATTMMRARNATPSGKRKRGASGMPVKSFDFEDADVREPAKTPLTTRNRAQTMSPPSTSGRGRSVKGTPGTCVASPAIGVGMTSPAIVGRVGDVVARLGSDCDSESEAETETAEDEDDDDMGGTMPCDEEEYGGATQVLDSAAFCDAPSRADAFGPPESVPEETEPTCPRGGDAAIRLLRRRLFGVNRERPVDAEGLEFAPNLKAHRDRLLDILEDTVSGGQNNSVLVVGARGSGKSLALDSALHMLERRHPGKVVTVHLSGLLHADERVAMQKIASQLCPNVSEDILGRGSGGGFAENVAFMTEMLKLLQGGSRGVIFVLDDFELFAMRSKQTLLYAVTDLLQQSSVQAAVVGVTQRHSVERLLEKRVASRFSNRRIVFAPQGNSTSMLDAVVKALKLSEKDAYLCPSDPDYVAQWNLHLRAAMQHPAVKEKLDRFGRLENTPFAVSKVAGAVLSRVNRQLGKITSQDVMDAVDGLYRNPFIDSLIGATPLELLICVAMYRMHTARKRPSFTFEALAQEFKDMGTKEQLTHAKDCARSVLVRAFENLLALGIATAHKSGSGVRGAAVKEYKNIVLVVDPEELREAIREHPNAIPGLADYMDHESLRIAHTV